MEADNDEVVAPESVEPAGWKTSRGVGVVAALLVLMSAGVLALFFSQPPEGMRTHTFICASSGKTFTVRIDPGDAATDAFDVEPGRAVACRFDELKDAYIAMRDESGVWVQAPTPLPEEEEDESELTPEELAMRRSERASEVADSVELRRRLESLGVGGGSRGDGAAGGGRQRRGGAREGAADAAAVVEPPAESAQGVSETQESAELVADAEPAAQTDDAAAWGGEGGDVSEQ